MPRRWAAFADSTSGSTRTATVDPSSTSAGNPTTSCRPDRPEKVSGTPSTGNAVSPVRSTEDAAVAMAPRTAPPVRSRSVAKSLPVATARPRASSTTKVIRR